MLRKTITFEDLEGRQITEDFYFNLSRAEIIEMEVSEKEGLRETLQKVIKEDDRQKIIGYFKKIILAAYGIKSEDGRRFIKSDDLRQSFSQTDAYSALFMELATDANAAAEFMNGIVPAGLAAEAQAEIAKQEVVQGEIVSEEVKLNELTREELLERFKQKMSQ